MATLGIMYLARKGLVWGQMRGCYLKSGGLHPLGGLYSILACAGSAPVNCQFQQIHLQVSLEFSMRIYRLIQNGERLFHDSGPPKLYVLLW